MKYSHVSIVIPNWNGKHLLEKFLPAVIHASKGAEIIVVDDCSSDKSVEFVRKQFPEVIVLEKQKRDGFGSTVNFGVEHAKGEIIVLLNTDIKPGPGFLPPLLKHFDDKKVFAVGCMDKSIEGELVVLRGRGKATWKNGFYVHSKGEVDKSDTAWVSGGSGAFRKEMWHKLGGMDPIYNPFYWEDIDLSYRALKAGYTIIFEPRGVVEHHHEIGKIKSAYKQFTVSRIAARNQFIFIWKNISDLDFLVSHVFWTPVQLVRSLIRGEFAFVFGYVSAVMRLLFVLKQRYKQKAQWRKKDREIINAT